MLKTSRLILLTMAIAIAGMAGIATSQAAIVTHGDTMAGRSQADSLVGKTLYTQENMYSLKGKVVTWVNYHVDALIPVNTAVVINDIRGAGLSFTIKSTGQTLRLKNAERHSKLDGRAWAERHFGPNRVDLHKFSRVEQEAIAAAQVRIGMSKAAVLVAYGYPPAHRTPSLSANRWLYWINRWHKVAVEFDAHGHVSQIVR